MCRETGSFLSLPSHTCGVSGPEPTSLHSTGTRIRGLCCSVWCKCRHSAAPWDRAAWGFFFPPKPVIFWVWKEKSKADSLPIKAGGGGSGRAYLLSSSVIYQSALCAAACRAPVLPSSPRFTFCLLHAAPRSRSLSSLSRTNVLAGRSLSSTFGLGHLSRRDSLHGYFWRLGRNCVLFIKTHIQWGPIRLTGWWKFLLCLLLHIWRFSWD